MKSDLYVLNGAIFQCMHNVNKDWNRSQDNEIS